MHVCPSGFRPDVGSLTSKGVVAAPRYVYFVRNALTANSVKCQRNGIHTSGDCASFIRIGFISDISLCYPAIVSTVPSEYTLVVHSLTRR